MAAQQKSRWAFISQAVASVESGLDKILADEDEAAKKVATKPTPSQATGSTPRASGDLKRSDSNRKQNDRLQARLAQAMAKKESSRATTPTPVSEPSTPPVLAATASEGGTAREVGKEEQNGEQHEPENTLEAVGIPTVDGASVEDAQAPTRISSTSSRKSKEINLSLERPRQSLTSGKVSSELPSRTSLADMQEDQDAKLLDVQLEHEKSVSAMQDEINGYLERIDALQRNMQILTKESLARAKEIKADAEATPVEKQLAEKDEKIALLVEEGTKLTRSEMQYRNIIKKLRSETVTLTKDQTAARQRAQKAESSISALEARARKAEADAKQRAQELTNASKDTSSVAEITRERNALQQTLSDIKSQLSKANKRAEDAEAKAQSDKLEAEWRKTAELTDDLSSLKVERELSNDKFKREIGDLKQALQREKEQSRSMENEMLAEQAALESKLESFRLRAEEATTGDQGDSHAKLLRQIEILQSQYSAASQNWQGIESTLLARITALEKERDEVTAREADLRRKLRDATSKAKGATKELEEVQQTLNTLQDRQSDESAEAQRAIRRSAQLESDVSRLRKELEDQRQRAERDMARRLEEEKAKWIASIPRTDSPVASVKRSHHGLLMDTLMSPTLERPSSRRSSALPPNDFANSRINSMASLRTNGIIPETPSITLQDDQDDFFANVPMTPASHTESPSRHLNEVISASTAGAGPSVQLVERLSMNVRRLENEKAASKDEMTRLSTQRDEARQEVVNLLREVEQKRNAEERLKAIEKEHEEQSKKMQATLELLGEKTEQVEELKADIVDVKAMYKQLADTMGRQ